MRLPSVKARCVNVSCRKEYSLPFLNGHVRHIERWTWAVGWKAFDVRRFIILVFFDCSIVMFPLLRLISFPVRDTQAPGLFIQHHTRAAIAQHTAQAGHIRRDTHPAFAISNRDCLLYTSDAADE